MTISILIWKTILEIGRKQKKDLIFVSGDTKADWWHQSSHRPLYPRSELIEEYRRESEGGSFHILGFGDFLKLFGAGKELSLIHI